MADMRDDLIILQSVLSGAELPPDAAPVALLCRAAANNDLDDLAAMLKAGVDANAALVLTLPKMRLDDEERVKTPAERFAIEAGLDGYEPGKVRFRPLTVAARNGKSGAASLLLDAGADPNGDSSVGPPLAQAVMNGHDDVARVLIDRGADIHRRDRAGASLLLLAARAPHARVVRLLLDRGLDPNDIGDGAAPLTDAAFRGAAPVIRQLLDAGANVDHVGRSSKSTALMAAAACGHLDAVRELRTAKPDLWLKDQYGQTAYDIARRQKHWEVAAVLKGAGAGGPASAKPADLLRAAEVGDVAAMREALENGVRIDWKNPYEFDGRTALMIAADKGHADAVRLLIDAGANVKERSSDTYFGGTTALHYAARAGRVEVMKILLAAGAPPTVPGEDSAGDETGTPLHAAADRGHLEAVKLLLEHGADPGDRRGGNTPVERAACDGHDEIIRLLVAGGAKLTDGSDDRRTVLHNAAANGNLKTVKLLLGLGMGLNTMCRDGTPLHAAAVAMDARGAQGGQPVTGAVIRHLLAKGADPNLANRAGEVPVHFATRWPAILQLLLDHGADPNARKADGTNAVWWATVLNAPASLELLLARGCDPNAVEAAENNSSLDAAIQLKHKKCRALLEAAGALTAADVNACDSGRKLMGKAKAKAKSGSRGRAGK